MAEAQLVCSCPSLWPVLMAEVRLVFSLASCYAVCTCSLMAFQLLKYISNPSLIWEQYYILNTWIVVSNDLYKLLFYQTQNNISMVMFESPQETSGKFSKTFPDDWVMSDTQPNNVLRNESAQLILKELLRHSWNPNLVARHCSLAHSRWLCALTEPKLFIVGDLALTLDHRKQINMWTMS